MSDDTIAESPGATDSGPAEQSPDPAKAAGPAEAKPSSTGTSAPDKPGTEEEPDPRKTTSDPSKARRLGQDARALEEAVAAILGERGRSGGIGNIIVAQTIGLVDAGVPRSAHGLSFGAVPSGPINSDALRSVAAAFVAPASYPELRKRLRDNWIVLLRAPSGWGRTAAALHLLGRECLDGVDKLNPDTSLRAPGTMGLFRDHGYLLESLDLDQAVGLSEYTLDQLRGKLEEVGARMVVLVDSSTPLRERELAAYLVDGAERPDARALVVSHFTMRLAAAGKADVALVDHPDFEAVVQEYAAMTPRAHDLAELAAGLSQVVLGEVQLDEVRQRYTRNAATTFREWFEKLDGIGPRAFAISLAVFDGMPLHKVSDAATQLAKAFQAAENPDRRARTRKVFEVRRQTLVELVEAEITSAVEDGDFGSLAVEVVRYRDPTRPRMVLEYVWREYDEAHRVVRSWLRALGSSPDRQVRIRAGVAVGLLSLSEFDHARQYVIEPWADCGKSWERAAAIGALRLPSMQPELQPLITRVIVRWLSRSQPIGRRITGILALGALPLTSVERALKLLRRAAASTEKLSIGESTAVTLAIAESVTKLGLTADRLSTVLRTLLGWMSAQRSDVRANGLYCVVQLSAYLEVSVENSAEPWPALLWLADVDRHHLEPVRFGNRHAIAGLIARVLEAPHFVQVGYELIRQWVRTAQRDPSQREPLGALLLDVAEITEDVGSLRFYLNSWASVKKGPVDAVAEILTVLDPEGEQP